MKEERDIERREFLRLGAKFILVTSAYEIMGILPDNKSMAQAEYQNLASFVTVEKFISRAHKKIDRASGCKKACTNNCTNTCINSCTSSCTATCTGSCINTCINCTACIQGCTSTCISTCTGGCTSSCTSSCTGGCTRCTVSACTAKMKE